MGLGHDFYLQKQRASYLTVLVQPQPAAKHQAAVHSLCPPTVGWGKGLKKKGKTCGLR